MVKDFPTTAADIDMKSAELTGDLQVDRLSFKVFCLLDNIDKLPKRNTDHSKDKFLQIYGIIL